MRAFARQMTERMKAVAAAGAVAAFWLAAWMLVAALVAQPLILPGPGAVVAALLRLSVPGRFWRARAYGFWAGWLLPRYAAVCWPGFLYGRGRLPAWRRRHFRL